MRTGSMGFSLTKWVSGTPLVAPPLTTSKTLQTIAFLAHLREKGIGGPFLIVAPLSTTNNWRDEFKRCARAHGRG